MKQIKVNFGEKDYRTEESLKTLRTNIMFSGIENKVIAITSCTPNEGKSTISLSLAKALAEGGKNVLLIDADLRKSILASKIKVNGELKGLSHFLSGMVDANDMMCRTQIEKLVLVPAGIIPPNPSELLGQKRFEALINSARKIYDYIIIDTPPLGSVIDGAVVAKVCDAAVLVVAAGEISYKYARVVKDQLEKSDCHILGVVLNKVDMKKDKYYGKYYGRYYGEYGKYSE